tara:strand:- start:10 stop:309 length:300 start_codon:yes stop_codon:yes gene_type:complete
MDKKECKILKNFDEFVSIYKPIKNTIVEDSCYDGYMFETYDREFNFVKKMQKKNPYYIWTLLDCDTITQGLHFVNRMGYFICEVPFDEDGEYEYFFEDK